MPGEPSNDVDWFGVSPKLPYGLLTIIFECIGIYAKEEKNFLKAQKHYTLNPYIDSTSTLSAFLLMPSYKFSYRGETTKP